MYDLRVIGNRHVNYFTLLLNALAIVVEVIIGEQLHGDTLIKDQDDGDHGVMPVTMEILTVLWRWKSKAQDDDGHIMSHILIACDAYLLCILFCLVRR